MMKCENCEQDHDGSYGSGRFCSTKCSRGFSTKSKRKEINEKVSKALIGRPFHGNSRLPYNDIITLTCEMCKKKFTIQYNKRKRKGCSIKCSNLLTATKVKGQHWKVKDSTKMGGPRPGGGRSKALNYISPIAGMVKLNNDEIKVAKYFDQLEIKWERNTRGFPYITEEGISRKYYPDFYIIDKDLYVEYKGWVTEQMEHKMLDAQKKNINLNLLIIYGNDKRYANMGICLNDIKKDITILSRCLV